jgi:hypothetical protein
VYSCYISAFHSLRVTCNNYSFLVTEEALESPEVEEPENITTASTNDVNISQKSLPEKITTASTIEANSSQKSDPELPNELPVQLKV